jgi:hypothetical protein
MNVKGPQLFSPPGLIAIVQGLAGPLRTAPARPSRRSMSVWGRTGAAMLP